MLNNDVLIKLDATVLTDAHGYTTRLYTDLEGSICDRQPYSPALALKEYGITDAGVKWRVFTLPFAIKAGDYVRLMSDNTPAFLVVKAHTWESHTEVILSVVS